ncbi:MAG: hypothetical protein PHV74_12960 [Dehalococcoidia bacterium]|nr:hypothetical protein [Dehalococcoidia bacterium]
MLKILNERKKWIMFLPELPLDVSIERFAQHLQGQVAEAGISAIAGRRVSVNEVLERFHTMHPDMEIEGDLSKYDGASPCPAMEFETDLDEAFRLWLFFETELDLKPRLEPLDATDPDWPKSKEWCKGMLRDVAMCHAMMAGAPKRNDIFGKLAYLFSAVLTPMVFVTAYENDPRWL